MNSRILKRRLLPISGRLNFKAGDKADDMKNQGAISTPAGGKVYLIAPNVENSGVITSPNGEVLLAAGHTMQLVDSLDPNMQVVLSAPENEALNLGRVIAQAGRTGMIGALVRQRGIVNASISAGPGSVTLQSGNNIAQSGTSTVTASGLTATATNGSIGLNGSNAVGNFTGSAATTLDFKNGATDLAVLGLAAGGKRAQR